MIKRSIQEEDVMCVNVYTPNIGAPKDINANRQRKKLTGIQQQETCTSHSYQWREPLDRISISNRDPK